MKRTTKGALAAGTAAVLLTGGASTLAFWSDGSTITNPDLDAGQLDLAVTSCPADWTLDGVGGAGGALGVREIVPGDTLTKTCTYTITAEGDHLEGELDVDQTLLSLDVNGLEDELVLTGTFTINGGPFTNAVITPATPVAFEDGTYTVTADLVADFPFGVEDNGSQNGVVTLEDIAVTLTQTDSH